MRGHIQERIRGTDGVVDKGAYAGEDKRARCRGG